MRMQPPANTNEADANELSNDEQGDRYKLAQAEELFIRFMEANGRPVWDEQELVDWCSRSDHERPIRPRPGLIRVALMGALDAATGELVVSISPTKTSADFIALLRRLDWRHSPKPGGTRPPVVLVLDNGPIHTSKATRAALAERPWITVEWLPRYAPELNDIERSWRDLKRHHLAHHTFKNADDLIAAIHAAVRQLNKERQTPHPCDKLNKAA